MFIDFKGLSIGVNSVTLAVHSSTVNATPCVISTCLSFAMLG